MNTKHTLKYAEEPSLDDLFVVKKFNEWMLEGRDEPVPKMLFGSLWREGEIAVLSADPGAGKSLLAVQIAESIAGGKKFFSSPPYEGGVAPDSGDGVVLCKSPHAGISTDPHAENHPSYRASQVYKKTGITPKLCEDKQYAEFMGVASEQQQLNNDQQPQPQINADEADKDKNDLHLSVSSASSAVNGHHSPVTTKRSDADAMNSDPALKHAITDHGKDIWIEKEDERGRPILWWSFDSKGRRQKHERDANGILITRDKDPDKLE